VQVSCEIKVSIAHLSYISTAILMCILLYSQLPFTVGSLLSISCQSLVHSTVRSAALPQSFIPIILRSSRYIHKQPTSPAILLPFYCVILPFDCILCTIIAHYSFSTVNLLHTNKNNDHEKGPQKQPRIRFFVKKLCIVEPSG